jgi:serine-type D-Ala-D-Ala carboxypeptidase (penicillin-binding protein 5/6)
MPATLALLATIFVASCSSVPHGDTTSSSGNSAYAAPAPPIYQPLVYPALASQPQRMVIPAPPLFPQQQQQPASRVFASASNVGSNAPAINAASYILVDARSGDVIAARNADSVRGVASTQKILTALIVAEAGDLDQPVRVAASDVAVEPSKLGVKPGEVYTRRQLLIAFLVKSANDLANVLARDNAGSITAFGAKMTAKARSLGATNSVFRNPHGLTAEGQHSTARDMARIALAAYRNPVIRDAVRRKYHTFKYANGRTVTLENTNDLLGRMPECDGMKTGYTVPAGRCLISCAHRGNKEVILVQLGTKTKYIWNDGAKLMKYGLAR